MSNASRHSSLPGQLRELVRADQQRRARQKLDELLLEGIRSGPAEDVTPAYIDEMTAEMDAIIERKHRSERRPHASFSA